MEPKGIAFINFSDLDLHTSFLVFVKVVESKDILKKLYDPKTYLIEEETSIKRYILEPKNVEGQLIFRLWNSGESL